MAALGNKVRFIQFNGTLTEWNQSISNNDWFDAVVFGYILDEQNNKVIQKIYAGKDTWGVDYIFAFDKDVCRWNYGDVSQGWHDASTKIGNKVGQITTSMTIGDLINVTNGGELSRIIEMMLFKQPSPYISILSATQTYGSEKHSITVNFKALNAEECYIKITDANSKVIFDSSVSSTYNNTFGQVIPGMTYTVVANASANGETVTNATQIATAQATQPTVAFNNIECTDNSSNNYYRLTDISLNVHENDYFIDSTSTWKVNSSDNITTDDLMQIDFEYGENYNITQHYKGKCIYQYQGESGDFVNFDSDTSSFKKALPQTFDVSIQKINSSAVSEEIIAISNTSFNMQYGIQPRLRNATVQIYVDSSNVSTLYNMSASTYDYVYDMTNFSSGNHTLNVSLSDEYGNCGKSNIVNINYQAIQPQITMLDVSTEKVYISGDYKLRANVYINAVNAQSRKMRITDTSTGRILADWVFVTHTPEACNGLVCDTNYKVEAKAIYNTLSDVSVLYFDTSSAIDASIAIVNISTNTSLNTFALTDISLNLTTNDYKFDTEYYNAYNVTDNVSICTNVTYNDLLNDCSQLSLGKSYKFYVNADVSCKYHYDDVAPVMKTIRSNEYVYTAPAITEYLYTQLSYNSSAYYQEIEDTISVNGNNAITAVAGSTVANVITAVLDPTYDQGGDISAGMLLDFIDKAKDVSYYNITTDETVIVGDKTYYKHVMDTYTNTAFLMLIPAGYNAELWDSAIGGTAPQTQLTFTKSVNTITVNGKQYYVWYNDQWHTASVTGGVYFFYLY